MPAVLTKRREESVTWVEFKGTAFVLGVFGLVGVVFVLLQNQITVSVGLLIAFCAAAVGIGLGFLMGTPPAATDSAAGTNRPPASTHLEQVSDWLTKVLIGAGLVQLQKVPEALQSMANAIAAKDGLVTATIICLLVSFFILGFFVGYLATRLFLSAAFDRADIQLARIAAVAGAGAGAQTGAVAGALTGARTGAIAGAQKGAEAGAIEGAVAGAETGAAAGAITGGQVASEAGGEQGAGADGDSQAEGAGAANDEAKKPRTDGDAAQAQEGGPSADASQAPKKE